MVRLLDSGLTLGCPNSPVVGCFRYVLTPEGVDQNANVNAWRNEEDGSWKEDQLVNIITMEELDALKAVLVGGRNQEDIIAWSYTKNGDFSVRSAYHLEMQLRSKVGSLSDDSGRKMFWKRLWAANVPPKVKNLVSRALNNGLPTKAKPRGSGLLVDHLRPRCGERSETMEHMLFNCEDSRLLRKISPLRLEFPHEGPPLFQWCLEFLSKGAGEQIWELVLCFIWQICNCRNRWLFDQKEEEVITVCARTLGFLGEYQAAAVRELVNRDDTRPRATSWNPPTAGRWKLNTDATTSSKGPTGLGMIFRDSLGDVMMSASCPLQANIDDELQAEAEAL